MMTVLRTKPSFHSSSSQLSLRSTSTASPAVATASLRNRILASAISRSLSVCRCRVGKQEVTYLLFQPAGAAVCRRDAMDVDNLGLDPAGMRRQQQNAIA